MLSQWLWEIILFFRGGRFGAFSFDMPSTIAADDAWRSIVPQPVISYARHNLGLTDALLATLLANASLVNAVYATQRLELNRFAIAAAHTCCTIPCVDSR